MKKIYIAPIAEIISLDMESLLTTFTGRKYLDNTTQVNDGTNIGIGKDDGTGTLIIGWGGKTGGGGIKEADANATDWDDDIDF